jgi:hypothetical protein
VTGIKGQCQRNDCSVIYASVSDLIFTFKPERKRAVLDTASFNFPPLSSEDISSHLPRSISGIAHTTNQTVTTTAFNHQPPTIRQWQLKTKLKRSTKDKAEPNRTANVLLLLAHTQSRGGGIHTKARRYAFTPHTPDKLHSNRSKKRPMEDVDRGTEGRVDGWMVWISGWVGWTEKWRK